MFVTKKKIHDKVNGTSCHQVLKNLNSTSSVDKRQFVQKRVVQNAKV
jgi:hypothetical protein